jgi:hypothetical protein
LPSLPRTNFAQAFEESVVISSERFNAAIPFSFVWKIKKLLNTGSEKQLRIAILEVREFAKNIIREKKHELKEKASLDSIDILSRFLSSGHSDENFVTDIVISFILAGREVQCGNPNFSGNNETQFFWVFLSYFWTFVIHYNFLVFFFFF